MKTYISLFSSAGVGCYGFKQEGFECVVTNELLEKRMNIQKANQKAKYKESYVIGDIQEETTKLNIQKAIENFIKNEKMKKLDLDVIIATPPCQGMSVFNHKKKNELNRNSLVVESIKFIKELKPKFFILENVKTFLKTICTDVDELDKTIENAIMENLGGVYNIHSQIINFKDYGSGSSRTRTLVLGTRKDLSEVTPLDIFPEFESEKTLKEIIGYLPSLDSMGDICPNDIYHSFKKYNLRMLSWIKDIKEGESAFDNVDLEKIPHQIKNGEIIYNQNKTGDKYKRQYWNKVGPCIHTRNDILSSQNTVHPSDNRVFSIRELMLMMSIPIEFKWTNDTLSELNKMSLIDKEAFLKTNEMTIRHAIGEAVPTIIFNKIAKLINKSLSSIILTEKEIEVIIQNYKLYKFENLTKFIDENILNLNYINLFKIAELSNEQRQETAAYYTKQDICYSSISSLPDGRFFKKNVIRILEPSVGVGNFIPQLLKKYQNFDLEIYLCDIDDKSLEICKLLIKKFYKNENVKFYFLNKDFLIEKFENIRFDIIIGNPPYGKSKNNIYKMQSLNNNTTNLFSYFIEKAIQLGTFISLIIPKSFLNSPEYSKTRELIQEYSFKKIIDFGETAFNVKIETICIVFSTKQQSSNIIEIESYPKKSYYYKNQDYLLKNDFKSWLIYRDTFFDTIANKMEFNIFDVFRDRQITNKFLSTTLMEIRVLKSKNIGNLEVINIDKYDSFISEENAKKFQVYKFINQDNVVLVPNLTYYPRATFLPKNSIVNGSVALMFPKKEITAHDLEYFSSQEFQDFYRIARNFGTRTLNIDKNSVLFFGKIKQ
ncbi:DNA cytosine methyltransferase [Cetobacterium sp.]|uniref:DNA cytosine methyltransferase n=1 Tax=Cetobacterium sp. TaxID=2071632 RepID=UPI003F4085D6